MRRGAAILALGLVAGCAQPGMKTVVAPPPPPVSTVGLEQVMGASPQRVVQLLGSPGLDRTEGRGRHLQFAQGTCVLDVFFYPPASGGEPVATYADARMKDGRPLDSASCLQLQLKAQKPLS